MSVDDSKQPKHDYEHVSIKALTELFFSRTISYRGEYAKITYGSPQGKKLGPIGAIFLSQAGWMTDTYGDEHGWFHVPQKDLEDQTGLSDDQQKRVREDLIARQLLEESNHGEDVDLRPNYAIRTGGKLFYRIDKANLRQALEDICNGVAGGKPGSKKSPDEIRDERNRKAREKRAADRKKLEEAARVANTPQEHVSEKSGYTQTNLEVAQLSVIEGDICIPESGMHVPEVTGSMSPPNAEAPLIRQQQRELEGKDIQQVAAALLGVDLSPNSLDVVVDGADGADEIDAEFRNIVFKDLQSEGLTAAQANAMLDRYGLQSCDAALNTPGAVTGLLEQLGRVVPTSPLPSAAPALSNAATAPKPVVQPKSAAPLSPSVDTEAFARAKALQLGVKSRPLDQAIKKLGAARVYEIVSDYLEGAYGESPSPAAHLTAALKDNWIPAKRRKAPAPLPAEISLDEAVSEAEAKEAARRADAVALAAADAEAQRLDEEWPYLKEFIQIRIEMLVKLQLGAFGGHDADGLRVRALRRELQRAHNEGKLDQVAAEIKAAREANG